MSVSLSWRRKTSCPPLRRAAASCSFQSREERPGEDSLMGEVPPYADDGQPGAGQKRRRALDRSQRAGRELTSGHPETRRPGRSASRLVTPHWRGRSRLQGQLTSGLPAVDSSLASDAHSQTGRIVHQSSGASWMSVAVGPMRPACFFGALTSGLAPDLTWRARLMISRWI